MASHLSFYFALAVLLATVVDASNSISSTSDEAVGISKSLFAWWKLDEKIGFLVADSSGNKATGLVKQAGSQLAHTTDGIVFDGATYISMGTTPSLSGQTDFAVHAWVKVPPHIKQQLCVIQQRSDIYGEWWLWILNGNLWFTVYNREYQFNIKGTVPVTDGTWHHVAAVRNGTVGSIYVDSKLDKSQNGSKIVNLNSSLPVFIGYDPRDNKRYFHGELKEVQIFSAAVVPVGFNPMSSYGIIIYISLVSIVPQSNKDVWTEWQHSTCVAVLRQNSAADCCFREWHACSACLEWALAAGNDAIAMPGQQYYRSNH
ncbi:hypothetical protein SELMODRAFT_443266 [Selaginella moellendorffii]|uniref:LamG-like jellyroll fold domain-containing protein n=1 Tax=Selaginella moellendorffii TaxID=88036 RepID=D8RZZ8_SELML|nr:hypothetical protein SELMODRAFT_443266 [Selaginella moellendorffii]